MMNDSDILMIIIIIYRNTIELYGMVWYGMYLFTKYLSI